MVRVDHWRPLPSPSRCSTAARGLAPPQCSDVRHAMRRRSPLLLLALAAAWCVLSSQRARPPHQNTVAPSPPQPTPRVRTIVAYSQRRQQELQQRIPVSCQETALTGAEDAVDEYSADQWEELLDAAFRDTDWPSPVTDARNRSRISDDHGRNEEDFDARMDNELLFETGWNKVNLSWHRVPNTNVHLFSAYHDRRLSGYHYVRVISMADANATTLYCQLWFYDAGPLVLEAVSTDLWVPAWGQSEGLSPRLISCPLPRNSSVAKLRGVSVAAHRPCELGSDVLPLPSPGDVSSMRRKDFAVCVKGLDFPENDVARSLVEWLEANRLLGADEFFVYVYSIHPNTQRVLDYYAARGLLHAIPITLPGNLPNEPLERSRFIRQNILEKRRNEIVPYNDCLYRNLERFRFVVPLDVDEVLVPVRGASWRDVFRELRADDPQVLRKYVSFAARNTYLVRRRGVAGTTRKAYLSAGLRAVKSFVRTSGALSVANHYALRPRLSLLLLAPSVARLNHYRRDCPQHAPECQQHDSGVDVADSTLERWQPLLRRRVGATLRELQLNPPIDGL